MKLQHLPCNLKYLGVACKRSNSDVGQLIKGLLAYMTVGKTMRFENEGMQTLYDLFVDDICDFLALKLKQSATNSNNARSRNNAGVQKSKSPKKKVNVETADKNTVVVEAPKDVTTDDEMSDCNDSEYSILDDPTSEEEYDLAMEEYRKEHPDDGNYLA